MDIYHCLHLVEKYGCLSFPSYVENNIESTCKESDFIIEYLNSLNRLEKEHIFELIYYDKIKR